MGSIVVVVVVVIVAVAVGLQRLRWDHWWTGFRILATPSFWLRTIGSKLDASLWSVAANSTIRVLANRSAEIWLSDRAGNFWLGHWRDWRSAESAAAANLLQNSC